MGNFFEGATSACLRIWLGQRGGKKEIKIREMTHGIEDTESVEHRVGECVLEKHVQKL